MIRTPTTSIGTTLWIDSSKVNMERVVLQPHLTSHLALFSLHLLKYQTWIWGCRGRFMIKYSPDNHGSLFEVCTQTCGSGTPDRVSWGYNKINLRLFKSWTDMKEYPSPIIIAHVTRWSCFFCFIFYFEFHIPFTQQEAKNKMSCCSFYWKLPIMYASVYIFFLLQKERR